MIISNNCVNIVKQFEGFRSKPYKCSAGIPTIGYGSTFYLNNEKVSMNDSEITKEFAEELLLKTLSDFSQSVDKLIKVELNQNQYDAIVSFCYNVGVGAFSNSTMLKLINVNDLTKASNEFIRWNKAKGKVVNGLTIRRKKEKELFDNPYKFMYI